MMRTKDEPAKAQSRAGRAPRAIVAPDALAKLKRRAEEFGVIVHAQPERTGAGAERREKRKKR
ncbi:MAG TPA: hypothetical protein VF525_06510 [Pyrinomonadaceae bacterium]